MLVSNIYFSKADIFHGWLMMKFCISMRLKKKFRKMCERCNQSLLSLFKRRLSNSKLETLSGSPGENMLNIWAFLLKFYSWCQLKVKKKDNYDLKRKMCETKHKFIKTPMHQLYNQSSLEDLQALIDDFKLWKVIWRWLMFWLK